ncbi:MAG: hypothetical protein WC525_08455 [Candidatus Thermoplasmatota archaeon]
MAIFLDKKLAIIGFIIFIVFSSGCITNNSESAPSSPIGEGFKDVTTEPLHSISMNEAISELNSTQMEPYHVHYVRGEKVDSNGLAQRWIFGIKQKTVNNFFIYDGSGITSLPWKSWMPVNEILVNEVLTPDDLFAMHTSKLLPYFENGNFSHTQLEIIDKEYHIIFESGESQVTLCFDSKTGTPKNC